MTSISQITLEQFVGLLVVIVPVVVWLVRLEGMVKMQRRESDLLKEEIGSLRTKHEALDSKVVEKLSLIEKTLARIEGYMFDKRENS